MTSRLPVLALIGRPNVGKSTLFNVLTGTRNALVYDLPGVTRDRHYGLAQYNDRQYLLIDTGGWGKFDDPLEVQMITQTEQAMEEADAILWVLDCLQGVAPEDLDLAQIIRKYNKPIFLLVNKSERQDDAVACSEFHVFGFHSVFPVSARTRSGLEELLEEVFQVLKLPESDDDQEAQDQSAIRVAIVGRPNVGKSTLINRFLNEERMVVFDAPGTTRDSIEVPFEYQNQRYILIDTAGVRRRSRINESLEHYSVSKTLQSVQEAQVIIFVLDAQLGIVGQDLDLLDFIVQSGRSLIIAINKWDHLPEDQKEWIKIDLKARLSFVSFAPLFFISALHGSSVGLLLPAVKKAYESACQEMPTSLLNRILEKLVEDHQPPLVHGRRIRLRYAHAGGHFPPTIIIHGKQTEDLPESYRRYLQNRFIEALDLVGCPLKLVFKTDNNPYVEASSASSTT